MNGFKCQVSISNKIIWVTNVFQSNGFAEIRKIQLNKTMMGKQMNHILLFVTPTFEGSGGITPSTVKGLPDTGFPS